MADTRHKNSNWAMRAGSEAKYEDAQLAVLMDIRDEMRGVRRHLECLENLARCPNVQRGFIAMNKIRLHLDKVLPAPAKKPRAKAKQK